MKYYTGCDAHKKYSVFVAINENGERTQSVRVDHDREELRCYLDTLPANSLIAVEAIGSWYWMVDEMEKAGHKPYLTHAGKAKKMAGQLNKTDKLDAHGLATLLKAGTLPSVWIPPGDLRDKRELPRTRMVFSSIRTKLKNRIHATLAKYNIQIEEVSDLFGRKGRLLLEESLIELPPETKRTTKEELKLLDKIEGQLQDMEKRIQEVVQETEEMKLLKTIPGVGAILSIVIALEIGDVSRFPGPANLASYAGTVPRIHSSRGRIYHGRVRPDVNRYLKWALVEAANVIVLNKKRLASRHVVQLYQRIKMKKGHPKAVVAVARHLAEASYWILKRGKPYKEPARRRCVSSTQGKREARMSFQKLVH